MVRAEPTSEHWLARWPFRTKHFVSQAENLSHQSVASRSQPAGPPVAVSDLAVARLLRALVARTTNGRST